MGSKTTHVRINKDTLKKIRQTIPGVPDNKRIDFLFDTSPVKLEYILKEKDFMNKMGTFIYGKAWKQQKR